MTQLLAFHGKQSIKKKYLARVRAHRKADQIMKGRYWEGGKGCAVGCTIHSAVHDAYEQELGIPTVLACLEDGLFENMANKDAMEFPERFLSAIPVGADLSLVFAKLVVWEWEDPQHGLKAIPEVASDAELVDCCERLVALYKRVIAGETVAENKWSELEILADRLARARAWAGAWAGAWAWARARAWAGAGAWAGARARAWAGEEYEKQVLITANKLIELLAEAPVPQETTA
jgi:hypothetical protein